MIQSLMLSNLRLLSVAPRVWNYSQATASIQETIGWSETLQLDGILFFTGAGAVLDPWMAAAATASSTSRLEPMIALNPLYTHPFAAARSLLSIAELFDRRVDLNLITGAAISEHTAVGDELSHGDRYLRLLEYMQVFLKLLTGEPVNNKGRYYVAKQLQLHPALNATLQPRLYLAGNSLEAGATASQLGATRLGMLSSNFDQIGTEFGAVNFGVIARDTAAEADVAAQAYFPDDPFGRSMFRVSLANTDSVWKRQMAESLGESDKTPFRIQPFRTFGADCPYLVGDYECILSCVTRIANSGVHTLLLDVPSNQGEHEHLDIVIRAIRNV